MTSRSAAARLLSELAAAWLLLALGVVVSSHPVHAATAVADSAASYSRRIKQQEAELKRLRGEIHDLRQRDGELKGKEQGTLKQLRLLEHETALTADLLRSLKSKQERVGTQLDGIRAEHESATQLLGERKAQLARTLRAMYVRGPTTTAEVLLGTTSLDDALSHFKYLGLLARNNERLFEDVRQEEAYLAHTDAKLTQTLAEVRSTSTETEAEKQRLAAARQTRQTTLQRVRQQRAEYQRALEDLSTSERKVTSLVAVLEKRRQAAIAAGKEAQTFPDVGFARLRGVMPWPVRGRVVGGYGTQRNPKHGTVTFNSGIDIAAAEGEPVRTVARGQVEYVQWLDGYGKTIIVNHGAGYYTVYAHLSETLVAESQSLEPGQVIGHVGDTGSLEGAQLHFELRSKADAVDPRQWLSR